MQSWYVTAFPDYPPSCREWLGDDPRPSKLALLEKMKDGKLKNRLILDCRRGPDGRGEHSVNAAAGLAQRIVLPRGQDVTVDLLDLLETRAAPREHVEAMVLDFTYAFYHIPLRHCERPYFCAAYKGRWMVFLTIAQGGKNAPLRWGRVAALIMRMTASRYPNDVLRAQCYVDDPIVCVNGTREERRLRLAVVAHLWRALDSPSPSRQAPSGTNSLGSA